MHLLQLLFAAFLGIFGEAFFHGLLQSIDGIATGVAHAHFGVLAFGLTLLGQLLAAFLGEGRDATCPTA